jgi:hypothetical protein
MSPIETIKLGLQKNDLDLVREGYLGLTGELVVKTEVENTTKTTRKKATRKKTTKKKAVKKTTVKKATTKKTATKKNSPKSGFILKDVEHEDSDGPIRWKGNLFESYSGHAEPLTDEESDKLADLIGDGGQKTKNYAAHYKPISKVCDKCHKTKQVNPAYIVPTAKRFYCDSCLDRMR